MFGIQSKILEYILVIAIVAGVAYFIYDAGYDAAETKAEIVQLKADKDAREKYNLIEKKLEEKKNVRQESARVITKEVEKIVERPVYLDRCWDDDGLRRANEAISGRNQSKSETTVPTNTAD